MTPNTEPSFYSAFHALRSSHREKQTRLETQEIRFSNEDVKQMIQLAKEAWEYVLSKEDVESLLQSLPSENVHKKLKEIRKFGLVYKSSFLIFGSEHKAPPAVYSFIKILGELNDRYTRESYGEFQKKTLQAYHEFQKWNESRDSMNTSTWEDAKKHLISKIDQVKSFISPDVISVGAYHDLRKRIKEMVNMIQLASALHPESQVFKETFDSLFVILEEMGDVHDNAVQSDLDNPGHYEQEVVNISNLKPRIANEMNGFEKLLLSL